MNFYNFQITDTDNINTIHQTHDCVIDSGDTGYLFIENSTVLSVSGLKRLDAEEKRELNFSVTCTDNGKYLRALSKTEWFVIKVKGEEEYEWKNLKMIKLPCILTRILAALLQV